MNDTDKNEVADNQLPPPPAEIPAEATEAAPEPSDGEDAGMFSPKPKTPYECAVAAYLEANASDALRDKIREAQKNGKGHAARMAGSSKNPGALTRPFNTASVSHSS